MSLLFSIITVTYNAENWVDRTIQSVLSQTCQEFEYIIIDGASTDRTMDIVKKYSHYISFWCSEPDEGLYYAMNKGLKRASGNYVWFLNAGDTLYSSNTLDLVKKIILNSSILPDILYGETALFDASGQFISMRRLKAPDHLTWKSFKKGMLVCHQAFIAKRKLVPVYNTNYRLVSDFDWCICCMKKAHEIRNTHQILVNFLIDGMSTINRMESLKERYAIMCNYYGKTSTIVWHFWFAIRFIKAKLFGIQL